MPPTVSLDTVENKPAGQDQEILDWLKAHPPASEALNDFHDKSFPGYRLIRELGQGAMSTVYLAEQLTLKRLVAIKVARFSQHQAHDWQRFQTEAYILSQLPHPGVLKVIDSGLLDNQRPYFVTEWCPGGHVGQKLHGQPLAPRAAASIVASLCDILEVVHQAGIVHRDLKPSNILVMEKDDTPLERCTLRIADFGLAKQITLDKCATLTHTTMGTPGYTAPEQWNDAKVAGPRADLYSLGALLYELLTGRPPFQAGSPISAIKLILHEDPVKPRLLQPGIDASLEAVCLKCLEKSPRDRYASAAELAADLRRFLNHEPVRAKPPGPIKQVNHWVRRHPVLSISGLAAGVLLMLGLLSLWQVTLSEERSRSNEELSRQAEYFRLMATIRERAAKPVVGWSYANLQDVEKARSLHYEGMDRGELKREFLRASLAFDLEKLAEVQNQKLGIILTVAWHPHQPWLAVGYALTLDHKTNVVDLFEAPSMKLLHRLEWDADQGGFGGNVKKNRDGIRSLLWNQDGKILLAGTRGGALQQFDFSQEAPRRQCRGHIPDGISRLCYSGDGRFIFACSAFDPWFKKLYRWKVQGGEPQLVWEGKQPINELAAIPGSSHMILVLQDGEIIGMEAESPHLEIKDCPVTYGVAIDEFRGRFITGYELEQWKLERGMKQVPSRQVNLTNLVLQINSSELRDRPLADRFLLGGTARHTLWLTDNKVFAYQRFRGPHIDFLEYAGSSPCLSATLGNTQVQSMSLDYQGKGRWFCCSFDDNIAVYRGRQQLQDSVDLNSESLLYFDMAPDGIQRLTFDGRTAITQLNKQRFSAEMPSFVSPPNDVQHLAIAPSQRQFAILHQSTMKICAQNEKKETVFPADHRRHQLAYSPDGILWVVGNQQIETVDHHMKLTSFPLPGKEYRSLSVSDRWLLALENSGTQPDVYDREGATGLKLAQMWSNNEPVECLTMDSSQSLVALGTRSGTVIIRQIPDGKVLRTMPACHREIITSIDWKGNTIATGGQDHWVRLWEEQNGQWRPTLEWEARGEIIKLKLTGDAKQLFTLVQGEYALRVFDLTSIGALLREHGWIK